jgi:hypothetical protein
VLAALDVERFAKIEMASVALAYSSTYASTIVLKTSGHLKKVTSLCGFNWNVATTEEKRPSPIQTKRPPLIFIDF